MIPAIYIPKLTPNPVLYLGFCEARNMLLPQMLPRLPMEIIRAIPIARLEDGVRLYAVRVRTHTNGQYKPVVTKRRKK